MRKVSIGCFLMVCFCSAGLLAQERERIDMEMMGKIREEGMKRSQVMTTISYLTDVHGPRLTGSPNIKRAAEWTRDKLTEWKLENSHLEPWGPFGRGWSVERFSINMVSPDYSPLIAYPKAWSPSTQRAVRGKPILLDAKTEADLDKYRGKLNKAIVLFAPARDVKALFDPPARRQTDANLLSLANSDPGARRGPQTEPGGSQASAGPSVPGGGPPEQRNAQLLQSSKWQLVQDEGAAIVLEPGRGDGGTVFVTAASVPQRGTARGQAGGGEAVAQERPSGQAAGGGGQPRRPSPWSTNAPEMIPQAMMAVEQYNRLVRMTELGVPVEIEVDLLTKYHTDDLMAFNVVAEIPGTDLKDEVVMLGGHFDSWHSGTGATDNAIGCGVALEAMRILKAIDAKPRRTIRIALWTGEEQGLLGSRAYVTQHFGRSVGGSGGGGGGGNRGGNANAEGGNAANAQNRPTQGGRYELKPEHAKFAGYFNLDNGGGKIRGIYLQGNEGVRSIFRSWLAPFADLGASTVSLANTGGTDHQSFDGVGLPGFQFIQDPLEYNSRTHHSSMDVFDRLIADDVKQASVIMASFVYNAATRDEKLPRKPLRGEVVNVDQSVAAAGE